MGFKAFALLGHYSATKWAVRGLNQAYAMEMAEHNITVRTFLFPHPPPPLILPFPHTRTHRALITNQCNAYAPGIVDTPMWDLIDSELSKKNGRGKGETFKYYIKELTALGRASEPEDVAKMVGFLASKDSDFVTGQTQLVDGGIVYT